MTDPGASTLLSSEWRLVDQHRLAAFTLFAGLPPDALAALADAAAEVPADAGARIVTHGDFGYVLYLIEEGEAEVNVDGGTASRLLGPGDAFGEIALLVSGRRTAEVVARTPMRLISLFERDVRRACAQVPELETSLRRTAGERLTQT